MCPADQRSDLHDVAFAHRHVDVLDFGRLLARRDDAAAVLLLQRRNAGGVIAMMVCHQDIGEPPSGVGESLVDGRGLRRIDGGRGAGRRIVQQNAVIVLQAQEEVGFGRHGWLATPARRRQASTPFKDAIPES